MNIKFAAQIIAYLWLFYPGESFAEVPELQDTKVLPSGLPPFIGDEISKEDLAIGKRLFYSTRLSRRKLSCATCHAADRFTTQPRNKINQNHQLHLLREIPMVANLYPMSSLMWDGRARRIEEQVLLPLESKCEMAIDWDSFLRELNQNREHWFASSSKTFIKREDVTRYLAAYVRRIVTGDSRFDAYFYKANDSALDAREIRGLALFRGKARCSSCHTIGSEFSLLTDGMFHVLGVDVVNGKFVDRGRYTQTLKTEDDGAFKTPTLRNITRTAPYMHDGSFSTLDAVIEFYNGGGRNLVEIDPKIQSLGLAKSEKEDLSAFLRSLESDIFVLNP